MNIRALIFLLGFIVVGYFLFGKPHVSNPTDPEFDKNGKPYYHSAHYTVPGNRMFTFPNTRGPSSISSTPLIQKTSWKTYSAGTTSRLAILLTDENAPWLGLAHGLKSIGVPFLITNDYKKALQHHVVLVYPSIEGGGLLQADGFRALAAFPRNGGILMGVNVLGGGLADTFGFKETVESNKHKEIHFDTHNTLAQNFMDPHEKSINLEDTLIVNSYTQPTDKPLATYEDGTAAITQKSIGKGKAYAFGMDLGQYILKGHNGRQASIARIYVNDYEPHADMLLRILRNIYISNQPDAVTLGTVPQGKDLSVVFTHDIDFTKSIHNAVEYARFEHDNSVPATHFIQTKYIRDDSDDIFYNEDGVNSAKQIKALGQTLASHSVSHSKTFNLFPMGSGKEQYPDYQPFVQRHWVTYNGSILGELRISKFLLENFVPAVKVESFRPGHLSNPFQLPEAMEAVGYRYSSSTSADNDLTHLPYQLNYGRATESESPIFEFPITVEDEKEPRMDKRLPQAIELAHKLKKEGGSFVILIHPNVVDFKLAFEKGFSAAVKPFAWFGNLETFGAWWVARNKITTDTSISGQELTIQLNAPLPIEGLTINVPKNWQLLPSSGFSAKQSGQKVLIEKLQGQQKLLLKHGSV
jgi:hypothetical protein